MGYERTVRQVDVGEVSLVLDEAGVGGRPMLLLHGWTGDRLDFEPLVDPLVERGWHVVVPDQRGHGDSDQPEGEDRYSLDLFARDALALTRVLGWDRFAVIGHSMGGMIAQEVALAAGDRVDALVLLSTTHGNVPLDPAMVAAGVQLVREQGVEAIVALTREHGGALDTPAHLLACERIPGYAERGDESTLRSSSDMYVAMGLELTGPLERIDRLGAVGCPTLVLVGEQDTPMLDASGRLAEVIPDASLVVLPEAGHSPQFEAPEVFFDALLPFLDGV